MQRSRILRVMVAGGGTGGHLFPGLAVVEELRRRRPQVEVVFVGTRRGIEATVLPRLGERLELIEALPLQGRSAGQLALSMAALPGALVRATQLLRLHRPDVVIGVGGYASGPLVLAASMLGIRTALLEQNAILGLTNRMLAPLVDRAYLSFAATSGIVEGQRARLSGNPVRRSFVRMARRASTDPAGFAARGRRIVVLGGSAGAAALNRVVPEALALAGVGVGKFDLEVLHQTGAAMSREVEQRYRELGIRASVSSFLDDMAGVYASAMLVISRAGATTVAELCAVGRPAVLVPYPHAADDHQHRNAQALAQIGAAVCMPEASLSPTGLGEIIASLVGDPGKRLEMAAAARSLGRPDAAAAIVDDLFETLEDLRPEPVRGYSLGFVYGCSTRLAAHRLLAATA